MSGISIILVFIVAFLAGVEGILDEFEFHQPLVACTLIGLVTGHLPECLILGGSLQMIARCCFSGRCPRGSRFRNHPRPRRTGHQGR